jgi:hypothetical protein
MEKKEGLWDFEDQMEDRWIEKQIEDEEQQLQELLADLSDPERKVYEVLSRGKQFTRDHISIARGILNSDHFDAEAYYTMSPEDRFRAYEEWTDHKPVMWYKNEDGETVLIWDHEINLTIADGEKDQ